MIICTDIDATIFYKHVPEEVAALEAATIPLAEQIHAVSNGFERGHLKRILGGEYFRYGQAKLVRAMLLRAAKHARMYLSDYFPLMREQIIADAEQLEEAIKAYWRDFERLTETVPTK